MQSGSILSLHWLMLGHDAKQIYMKLRVSGPNLLLLLLQVISLKNFHEIAESALPEDASTSHKWVLGRPRLGTAQSQHGFGGKFEQCKVKSEKNA